MADRCGRCGAELTDGARFCAACGGPVEHAAAPEERKLATVLFADLVGSTELGGAQDPERTRALLDRFYDAMAGELTAAGGTVEKFAGDAVMAAFGVPAAQEDHAERALHAALAMRRRLEDLFGGELQLRIGVNTGDVVAGRAREGSSFVTGDAVNVAARLEQAAEPGQILAGERTVAAARGAFEFGERTTVEAKGKPDGVRCARLVRALSLMRPRGVAGLRSTFVGRDAELGVLEATYGRVVAQGEPHVVTLMGDAGVGKTRLVRELWQWLAAQEPQAFQRTGRCLPYGQIAFWALGEVLKEHLGILESDPPDVARRRLGDREILGLALGLDVAGDLHPLAARDRLNEAWAGFLRELVAERPTVLLVEDLHWAEEPLLDLLERLARDVRGPLLLVGTARPELLDRRPAWGGGRRNASLLWLEPLPEEASRRLLDDAVGGRLPHGARDAIVEQAEGNPFFLEELLSALLEVGDQGAGKGRLRPPDSVQALLAARIDLLGPTEKAALHAASVIGRTFWPGAVAELTDGADVDYGALEDRDFVRRPAGSSMAGETEYAFKHSLTREVAYASVPKARRARMHAAFAGWIEQLGGDRDDLASVLAHHLAEAASPDDADLAWAGAEQELEALRARAVDRLRRAAELAVRRYDIDEAVSQLHRAVVLTGSRGEQVELWRRIGRANATKFDGEGFWTAMQRALELNDDDDGLRGEILSELAFQTSIRSGMWSRRPDSELVEGWIDEAVELTPPGSFVRGQALAARAHWHPREGEEAARTASEIAERVDDVELRSYAWAARAAVAFERRDFEEAATWAQRRFDLIDQIADPDHVQELYESLLPATNALGRLREGRRLAADHAARARRLTPHHRLHGLGVTFESDEVAGDWGTIAGLTDEAVASVAENEDTPCLRGPRCLLLAAAAAAVGGDGPSAARLERLAEECGMEDRGFGLAGPRLRLALIRGEHDVVESLLTPAPGYRYAFGVAPIATRLDGLAFLRRRDEAEAEAGPFTERTNVLTPFALRALGVVRGDDALVEQAQGLFAELGLDWHAQQTEPLLRG